MRGQRTPTHEQLVEGCLAAFVTAGTLDLSLDQLALRVGSSKRMLVHYFGGRENLEEQAMARLEEGLRAQLTPDTLSAGASLATVVEDLWEQATAPESKGVLLLVMDLSRRAWSGSARARAFYDEQQRLWVQLLMRFLPDAMVVDALLQLFQGAVLRYLITGDSAAGKRALLRFLQNCGSRRTAAQGSES